MRITNYDDDVIEFRCDACDFLGEMDISSLLTDNCVIDIDVVCELCSDMSVLYVLKCTDPVQAKPLSAMLETLRIKREAEDKNGY